MRSVGCGIISLSIHFCNFFVIMSVTGGKVSLVWQYVLMCQIPFVLLLQACFECIGRYDCVFLYVPDIMDIDL